MLTALDTARDIYIREFLKRLEMPDEAWIFETGYRGLDEEFKKIEAKYIKVRPQA